MIIDGKKISKEIYEDLKKQISENNLAKPKLGAILIGNNDESLRYIRQKKKWADFVGMNFELKHFDNSIKEEELLDFIIKWNNDTKISGYIIQLPIPENINTEKVLNAIKPEKDVDGFHPVNQGKILIGDKSGLTPCTPAGVIGIIEKLEIELSGKNVVVIGRSNIVGKPVAAMLINLGATVTVCNSRTKNIDDFTKNADIVICAVGKPGLLKLENINDKTIVIDVGFTVVDGKIFGDAEFEEINNNGNLITPVPGGVGRLTVANLLLNTYKAWEQNK